MTEIGTVTSIGVTGHGDYVATFLGPMSIAEVRRGDFIGVMLAGGLSYQVLRIGEMSWSRDGCTLFFDWNGFKDRRPGASLLADDVNVPADGRCKEVWRPFICHYCERPATLILDDGDELLCEQCSKDQFEKPSDWVVKLTPTSYRKRYRD